AQALDALLARLHLPLTAVLLFKTERPELIKRLTARWTNPRTGRVYNEISDPPKVRGICDDDGGELVQRPDDRPETVTKRLDVYEAQTAPLIDYYKRSGLLVPIDAMQPVEDVRKQIVAALGSSVAS
ncbi:MAG TPA: nucleoside monophosphate kinase, partial [Candidatus Binatia bacterium]|nr:nucleoside monophosphate kinase [Candidatus Binatia bacterium]